LVAKAVDDRADDDRRQKNAEIQHQENIALLREIDMNALAHFGHAEQRAECGECDSEDEHRGAGGEKKSPAVTVIPSREEDLRSSTATGNCPKIRESGRVSPSRVSPVKTFLHRPARCSDTAPHTSPTGNTPGFTSDVRRRGTATITSSPRANAQTFGPASIA